MKTLIRNALVFDGTASEPVDGTDVLIEDGVISRVLPTADAQAPAADAVVNASGMSLLPGLINCHTHLAMEGCAAPNEKLVATDSRMRTLEALANAQQALRAGFTTLRDCGSVKFEVIVLRDAIDAGLHAGPRIVACGQSLRVTGGAFVGPETDGVSAISTSARTQIKNGADFIKIHGTAGSSYSKSAVFGAAQMTQDEMTAAIDVARMAGRRSAVHALGLEGIGYAINAGAHSIEHGTELDDDGIARMRDADIFLVPTLASRFEVIARGAEAGIPDAMIESYKWILDRTLNVVRRADDRGVKIAYGSDSGAPLVAHDSVTREALLMSEGGMSTIDIISGMTGLAAENLGIADVAGRIAPGRSADLVLVAGDPRDDLRCLDSVSGVWKAGKSVGP